MKFSVLISVYIKEKPDYLNRAMQSIWDDQHIKPNQIVLVQDGPLTIELKKILGYWKERLGNILVLIPLEKNVGLGDALNIGLSNCKYNLVARMDADDIAYPERFKDQIKYMQENTNCDIVGSYVTEFNSDPDSIISSRKVFCSHEEIVKHAKIKNPFNHPSVLYKKSVVVNAGGYKKFDGFEDYYLWVRMIISGARCSNLGAPLVNMRTGHSMLSRRGGLRYAINETKLQYKFLQLGFISIFQFSMNMLIRIPIRLIPNKLRALIYRIIRD